MNITAPAVTAGAGFPEIAGVARASTRPPHAADPETAKPAAPGTDASQSRFGLIPATFTSTAPSRISSGYSASAHFFPRMHLPVWASNSHL